MLDEDVYSFILNKFSPEMSDEILRSFELLTGFGFQYAESEFIKLVMDSDNHHPDAISDVFLHMLNAQLSNLLLELHVNLHDDIELYHKNEVISGLYLVQHLEDYSYVEEVLDSHMTDDEKLIYVLEHVTTLTDIELMTIVDDPSPLLIKAIRELVGSKARMPTEEINANLITRLRQFSSFVGETPTLGIKLINDGMPPGLPLNTYIPYIDHKAPITQRALDIFSILLLSPEAYNLPLITYRKVSNQFFTEISDITKVDAILTHMVNDFERHITCSS